MDIIARTSDLFKARFLSPDYSGDDKAEYCACYLQAEREAGNGHPQIRKTADSSSAVPMAVVGDRLLSIY